MTLPETNDSQGVNFLPDWVLASGESLTGRGLELQMRLAEVWASAVAPLG
jgi:hypothetical protein